MAKKKDIADLDAWISARQEELAKQVGTVSAMLSRKDYSSPHQLRALRKIRAKLNKKLKAFNNYL